jgi:hypothetical protein
MRRMSLSPEFGIADLSLATKFCMPKPLSMKKLYAFSTPTFILFFFLQRALAQDVGPFLSDRFSLGSPTIYWKALYVNNITAYGNVSVGGGLTFPSLGAGILTSNASGVISSGPLTAAQIPLLPYLPLAGGTLTGPLLGTTANFSGVVTGSSDATFGGNLNLSNDATIGGNIKITKDASILGNASISGNTTISGTTTINGNTAIKGMFAGVTASFTSSITGPTVAPGDNSNNLATTAFVDNAISAHDGTLQENSSGYNLTAIGGYVNVLTDGLFDSTGIGYGANIDGNNEVVLGKRSWA